MDQFWAQIAAATIGGLISGAAGVGIALYTIGREKRATLDAESRATNDRQRVAAMQTASQIRFWLTETMHVLQEHEVFEAGNQSTDPNDVKMPNIPALPFENALDAISHLPSQIAEDVFMLIERKMTAEKEAGFTSFVEDNENAAELFDALLAGIWVDGVSIYMRLAALADWTAPAATEKEIALMRDRAGKLDKIRNQPSDLSLDGST